MLSLLALRLDHSTQRKYDKACGYPVHLLDRSFVGKEWQMTSLNKLVKDLSKLEAELSRFETKFGVKSQEFYEAMTRGDLEEFDALDDYRMQFIEWLALYKTWLSLDEKYCQVIARQPVNLQIMANLEPAHA